MQKVNRPHRKRLNVIFAVVGLIVVLADQISKGWIRGNLELGESLFDIGFFRIIHIYNTGAAFGIFRDHGTVFAVIAAFSIIIILLLVFVFYRRWAPYDGSLIRAGIGLVIGGTAGNLIDRLFNDGRVTDFIDFKVWPAFNIADAATVVGAIIVAACILFQARYEYQE